eukprot:CAMPEP_0114492662 /NCGR_PEP_ID=MMETSP0109-20121206/3680_1 /TAXON_ID=29199 /ORGANISM="Chlorarachnion reptans, Strain CCCM449" /LENGTH=35 /DNA_ID= /DNA_START= /DNA_END= /DNA_ORIENTATION=
MTARVRDSMETYSGPLTFSEFHRVEEGSGGKLAKT